MNLVARASKAKYIIETDSEKVARAKVEKGAFGSGRVKVHEK